MSSTLSERVGMQNFTTVRRTVSEEIARTRLGNSQLLYRLFIQTHGAIVCYMCLKFNLIELIFIISH